MVSCHFHSRGDGPWRLTVGKSIELVGWDVHSWLGQGEERNDGLARVTSNDWNDGLGWVLRAGESLDEGLGTNDIECGDTKELLWVKFAGLLENLSGDRNGAVDRVGDDQDEGIWAGLCDALDKTLNDACVDLEEVVTGHAGLACEIASACENGDNAEHCISTGPRPAHSQYITHRDRYPGARQSHIALAPYPLTRLLPFTQAAAATVTIVYERSVLTWNTSGNDNDVSASKGLLQTIVGWEVAINGGNRGDVRQVGGDTWGVHDIVQREVVDERRGLEEEGQWLTDTTGGTSDD